MTTVVFALYTEDSWVGRVYITIVVSSSWIDVLIVMYCPSLSLVTVSILKSILSDMNIANSVFFWFPFAEDAFSRLLTFSLCVSLDLKWVSYISYCFCIHSASLCLFVEAFNTFRLKVIFSIYVLQFSSVQFSLSVVSDSLRPHESQHARPPCLSPTPGVN